ncbi:hypothetical protein Tco_0653264 [Tanacetum coccineum]|uniref:Integrase, catalytic region, zinc finger, CCHC-type, peptidase aspartic, catalytic n=1 Tax=Tanacetum coccineum TaxID=301880 RepID=A0ABQ4X0P4_9ASTR
MVNLSEDIQCAGSDTRPPMLDKTDFASWQQRIRLYYQGKENRVNILKSIDEGPFQMGTFRETLAEGTEGVLHLRPERPRVYSDLTPKKKERYNADIRATNILLQGLPKDIYSLINHYTDAKDIWDNVKMLLEGSELTKEDRELNHKSGYGGAQNIVGNANQGQARQENMVPLDEEQLLFIAGGQDNAVDEDVDEQPVQDLALNVDYMFQADDYDAFDSDVDEDVLSEVYDNDHYQDTICEHHEIHEMHDDVQPNYVVDSHADYTSDSSMIPYDQYIKDNTVPVVHNNVSSVPNDAYMMILNDMHEPPAQYVSVTTQNNVVAKSLTAELATYKEQVKLYERRDRFELTKREQKIDEQLRIVITDLHNSEDTLEIAEITRKKMNDKMKDPECVKKRVKIAPPDYSRENYLATFTPQKQLTPEQIFWSNDLIEMKAEAFKEQTKALQPIKALTMYPPNTPATLVPRVLPTKSQVKINIFTLIQLFSEFEKTCKKRITPIGLTKGERGFEQTKKCYLTKVIPFFKTLKEHFEGIQKALTKEIKEMKDIFKKLEAEVDQNIIHRKHAKIERKNLLIANDNLIADCLSKYVFYITTNSELTVSRFTEMHDAHTIIQARCLELEAELSKLRDKIQIDDHNELVNRFSNLEITQLTEKVTTLQEQNELFRAENGKIKQHYKELYDSIKITRAKHIEQTTILLTENENLKVQIHNKMQCVTTNPVKPRVLAPGKYAINVEPIPPRNRNNREVHLDYLKHLKESVETIREIVEKAKVERPLGVNSCTDASRSQPRSNTKKNRILPAKSVHKKNIEEHPRTNKSNLKTKNRVDSSISSKHTVINSNSHTACKTCNNCLISANHDMCVVTYLHSVNASPCVKNVVRKVKQVWKPKQVKQVWKPTGKILPTVGYQWMPMGRTFSLEA